MQKPSKLFNRNFYLLWQGQSISNLGIQGFSIALVFWLKHTTGSATIMGITMMISALPAILFSPIGGALADRYSRRKILIASDLFNAFAVFALAAAIAFIPNNSTLILGIIILISVAMNISTAFFSPAISASIPDLVPHDKIMTANSLGQISFQLATFIGQGIGGTLFQVLGATMMFIINGITYLFAGVSSIFIQIPQRTAPVETHWREQVSQFKTDIADGLRYVWSRTGLRNLVLVSAMLNFFSMPVIVLMPFFVEDTLQASPAWYGYILAGYGVGSMLGYVLAGAFKISGLVRGRMMMAMLLLEAIGYAVLGLSTSPTMALVLAAVGGMFGGFVAINVTTLVQLQTPAEIRGRVFGLLSTIAAAISPLAMGLSGIIADLLGQNIPLIYILSGITMEVFALFICFNQAFRQFVSYEDPELRVTPAASEAL